LLSPRAGRVLSAAGAVLLAVALLQTWYHIDRAATLGDPDTTGWQTFHRLRLVILAGAAFVLVSAALRQTRGVLIARTLVGLVVAALIVRRIVDPPDLDYAVTPQLGVYLGALGALAAAAGGLIDSGREVVGARPDLAFGRGAPGELPRGTDAGEQRDRSRGADARDSAGRADAGSSGARRDGSRGEIVDSTATEI
jgi:hypothetical protein